MSLVEGSFRRLLIIGAAIVAAACTSPARDAAAATGTQVDTEKLKATLQQRFPDVVVERIEPAPIGGVYTVITATEIVYTDANGDYLLLGNIMDTRTRRNVTADTWNAHHTIDFASLPLDAAIKTVKGDGSRALAVFSDPDCPFCRQLEPELAKLNNVTIYTFLLPLESIHAGSTERAKRIWCSPDREKAWHEWMLQSVHPTAATCAVTPVEAILSLGEQFKVSTTPTIFLANGKRMSGALPAADLEVAIATAAKQPTATN